jgi:effector-binding domain-containing protein
VDVRVLTVEPSTTAVVAGPFDLSKIMASYDAVYAWSRGGQTDVRQVGQNIALYKHGREMEVGIEVDRPFAPVGDVIASELPGGRVAAAVHRTGYGDLRRTYAAIEAYLAANGLRGTGLCWEIYGDPDEHDHVDVEICFLLA